MIYLTLIALVVVNVCLWAAMGHLSREVRALRNGYGPMLTNQGTRLAVLEHQVFDPDPKLNQGTETPKPLWKRTAEVERLAASNEAAIDLSDQSIESLTNLDLMHAHQLTILHSKVDKLATERHYQAPVRKDN